MDIEKLDKKINAFLDNNEEPIISVTFDYYARIKRERIRICGVFSVWDKHDGILWLKNERGSRNQKNSIRMPVEIEARSIVSVKMLKTQDLIDNTNLLYQFTEAMKEKARKIS